MKRNNMDIADALDLYQQYILAEKGLSKQTYDSYLSDIEIFLQYFKDKKDTNELLGENIIEYLRYDSSTGRIKTVSTYLRKMSSIKSFYLFLKREGIINIEIPIFKSNNPETT